jgi:hypothetical protein
MQLPSLIYVLHFKEVDDAEDSRRTQKLPILSQDTHL